MYLQIVERILLYESPVKIYVTVGVSKNNQTRADKQAEVKTKRLEASLVKISRRSEKRDSRAPMKTTRREPAWKRFMHNNVRSRGVRPLEPGQQTKHK